ncbi:hypothetical protein [Actinokineospora xionganensis]|uniref:Uncharacterized protein n=1 Tax=Actinokineospora xionganensis TaxID=2684470 RepID=A0ABR7L968_9PSEU|nr:hypothetical protein [Actinokineospora xionganensis]MBC6449234.1 hypothetical protein [Actinokineospora xionganensis]
MTRAGETVGKAVGTGWRAARQGAARAGEAAQTAEQKLAAKGVAPKQMAEVIAETAHVARDEMAAQTRRARKQLAKAAKRASQSLEIPEQVSVPVKQLKKDLKPQVKAYKSELRDQIKAAKSAAKQAAKDPSNKRRKWPLFLLLAAAGGAAAVVMRGRSEQAPAAHTPKPEPVPAPKAKPVPRPESAERNGQANPAEPMTSDKN